jgi:ribonucleoside-diphosphate reductase alpha chain
MLPNEKEWINDLLKQRYYTKDETTWAEVCQRVAKLGKPHDKDMIFHHVLNCEFIPNSPTLFNAGTNNGNLSACYVLPMTDDLDEIFTTVKNTAIIHKYGGGTGFDFSRLRPEGFAVGGTNQSASGPLSFMRVIDANTQEIKQGGKRRGANMAILRIDHPDIIKFIKMKHEEGALSNFNISVAITDKFMENLQKYPNDLFVTTFNDSEFYVVKETSDWTELSSNMNYTYSQVWELITQSAWECADPGIVFIDRINSSTPAGYLDEVLIRATNPCGEQPLPDYGSCNLVALNINKFINEEQMDWDRLQTAIKYAYRLAEAVIDNNKYPIKEIATYSNKYRNIGIGVMGYADACIRLGFKYGSNEALSFGEEIMRFIYKWSLVESVEYAEKYGAFEGWNYEDYKLLIDGRQLPPLTRKSYKKTGIRNVCLTTIAPTGSIGYIADCSTGIEPHFANKVFRRDESHPEGVWITTPLAEQYPQSFVSATELDIEAHINTQSAFQNYVDSGISKTINMPNTATIADVQKAYMLAWDSNCKGVTIYRDGSKSVQVLNTSDSSFKPKQLEDISTAIRFRVEAEGLEGEYVYITVTHDSNEQPIEVFVNYPYINRPSVEHTERREQLDSISRLLSLSLRYNVPLEKLISQLEKSKGSMKGTVASISNVLKEYAARSGNHYTQRCEDCEGNMIYQGGCATCDSCGRSECG